MSIETPRLRMFAGPNGSGKSTIKSVVRPEMLGVYINPDEIEKQMKETNVIRFSDFGFETKAQEVLSFFTHSSLLKKANLLLEVENLRYNDDTLIFTDVSINSYFASVTADFIRQKLIEIKKSFTFETVMSSPDKVELLQKARENGYRTYLYYVATEDPEINISRIEYRISIGGHSVPRDKIVSRYKRSLELLLQATRNTDRAFIFDNSTHEQIWLAEITDGSKLEMKGDLIPNWFSKALLDKFAMTDELK